MRENQECTALSASAVKPRNHCRHHWRARTVVARPWIIYRRRKYFEVLRVFQVLSSTLSTSSTKSTKFRVRVRPVRLYMKVLHARRPRASKTQIESDVRDDEARFESKHQRPEFDRPTHYNPKIPLYPSI